MSDEKGEKKKRSGWWWFLIGTLIGLLVIALLALVPIGQLLLIKWMDFDSFRALVGRGSQELDVRFYQFVLSAITILIAVGAVLLYRERREVTEEKEKLEKTCTEANLELNKIKAISDPILKTLVEHQKSVSESVEAIAEIKKSKEAARAGQAVIAEAKAEAEDGVRKIQEIVSKISVERPTAIKEPAIGDTKMRAAWELAEEGYKLYQESKWAEAESKLRVSIALNPESEDARYTLGSALLFQKKWDEAIEEYKHAHRLCPSSPHPIEIIGRLLDMKGKRKEGREFWMKAEKLENEPKWVEMIKKRLAETD